MRPHPKLKQRLEVKSPILHEKIKPRQYQRPGGTLRFPGHRATLETTLKEPDLTTGGATVNKVLEKGLSCHCGPVRVSLNSVIVLEGNPVAMEDVKTARVGLQDGGCTKALVKQQQQQV